MKNLHSIAPERQKFDFTKYKFPEWILRFNEFNNTATNTLEEFRIFEDTARNYYINNTSVNITNIDYTTRTNEVVYNLTYTIDGNIRRPIIPPIRITDGI